MAIGAAGSERVLEPSCVGSKVNVDGGIPPCGPDFIYSFVFFDCIHTHVTNTLYNGLRIGVLVVS